MMKPLTVNMMTAAFTPGDAIGNYIRIKAAILRRWGVRVNIFADYVAPEYGAIASKSDYYRPNGASILWFHYSIYADNITIAQTSSDFVIMDYHGISPPRLFANSNPHLATLCQRAIDLLPTLIDSFDAAIVHSTYTQQELIDNGYAPSNIYHIPLAIDTAHFQVQGGDGAALAPHLSQLDYLLFVGRIVPQKDMLSLIKLMAALNQHQPDLALVLVGSSHLAPKYRRQIDALIAKHKLQNRVLFTGQINNPAQLAALFAHAKFYCALSDWESFCVPVAESLTFGTPAIVTTLPPLPEVAGKGGVIIDKRRVEESAETISTLLNDPAAYAQLREQALAQSHLYTDQALATNILTMFQSVWPQA